MVDRKRPAPTQDVEVDEHWEEKERDFHIRQRTEKAKLRISEGRPTPLDLLWINTVNCGQVCSRPALEIIKDERPEVLASEVDEIIQLCRSGRKSTPAIDEALDFWTVLREYLENIQRKSKGQLSSHSSAAIIKEEIMALFRGKSLEQLLKLQLGIQKKLQSKEPIDFEYWQSVMEELQFYKSSKILEEKYSELAASRMTETHNTKDIDSLTKVKESTELTETEPPSQDNWDDDPAAVRIYEKLKSRHFEANQVEYNDDVPPPKVPDYPWAKTHPPRKPLFFNWTYLGIEWTKYNQAHYNSQNPPPRTRSGHTFNLIYPRLVDPTKTPTYSTMADPEDPEHFHLIKFSGGAPYEDVYFRIDARPWEISYKQGFKCVFENGLLSLNFRFKKRLYRK